MVDNVYYSTAELIETIRTVRVPPKFFLDRYFRAAPYLSTREEIIFDEVLDDLPVMAPFVSPIVEAKPQKRSGFQAKAFRPAYVKPKHFLKPGDFYRRGPGEQLLGQRTPQQRMNEAMIDTFTYQRRQIETRWEWMAAQAVVNGSVVVEGEDYPRQLVEFGRDADNTIVVSGAGNLWSNVAADIEGMLEDWSVQILEKTGFPGTDIVMSPEAWKSARSNTGILKHFERFKGNAAIPDIQASVAREGVTYKGMIGEFAVYVYAGKFKEQDGSSVRAIAANDVIMTAAPSQEDGTGGVHGLRCFGAIQEAMNFVPQEIFPKMWEEHDPSGVQVMSQSAPLMVPGRPNAVIKATVQ